MRPEFDGEIDSVLRGHARRGGATPPALDGSLRASISERVAPGSHLDADEIVAFGEGVLPSAARARYAAHLADCDDCRRSVTQIALAAGAADRVEVRERAGVAAAGATQSPSWRERLSAVFAPRAWRYAMPVVALLAVSAVVLVVTRRLPREEALMTGERRDSAARQVSAPASPEAHHADEIQRQPSPQAGAKAGNAGTAGEDEDSGAAVDEVAKVRPKEVEEVGQTAAGGSAAPTGVKPEAAQQVRAEPPPPATQSYATTPQATPSPVPPAPAAAPAPRAMVLRDTAQPTPAPRPAPAETDEVARARDDSRNAAPRDEAPAAKRHGPQRGISGRAAELSAAEAPKDNRVARRTRGSQNNSQSNAQNNAAGASREDSDEAKAKREENREQQAEPRSVGGRRFRREGGVWIDTAYRPSQPTVFVRRSSEQYRALVADEPQIRQFSEQLGGEVIVVLRGRAYRLR